MSLQRVIHIVNVLDFSNFLHKETGLRSNLKTACKNLHNCTVAFCIKTRGMQKNDTYERSVKKKRPRVPPVGFCYNF